MAPIRAHTHYHQIDYQPGTPDILSFANRADLEAALDDVRRLRVEVDVVAVSIYWGFTSPAT